MAKSTRIAVIAAVAVAAVAATIAISRSGREENDEAATVETPRRPKIRDRKPYLVQKKAATSAVKYNRDGRRRRSGIPPGSFTAAASDGIFRDSNGKPYPDAEQKVMKAAAEAIENDDVESARGLAAAALESGNKELREAVVDALGWFGTDAMVELAPFMSDPSEDVADAAASHWKDALQAIEDDGLKAGVIEMSAKAIINKDLLEDVVNELVGIDELAAVQVVANIIESGGDEAKLEIAKEAYDSITGEKWDGFDSAEAWLQENYDTGEDDEEDVDEAD